MPKARNKTPRSNKYAIVATLFVVAAFGAALALSMRPPNATSPTRIKTPATSSPPAEIAASPLIEDAPEIDIDKATEHLLRGNQLLSERKLRDAIQEFRLAARNNPDDEDIYYNLALALAQHGETEAAKTNYAKALELFPDYVDAHNNLGNILVKEGAFEAAIQHFRSAIQADPENAAAHNNLGNAMARQKKSREAILHFEEAVRLRPDYSEALFNLGNAYLLNGRADEAFQQFSTLLKVSPNFPRAYEQMLKAKALHEQGAK